MSDQPFSQVDAFTASAFTGNPAAVCILPAARSAEWMQAVAMEMNLAETAFLVPADGHFDLRWFTPTTEVELCGHATLASAHVLWEEGHLAEGREARFQTRSGLLTAARKHGWIWLDFPAKPVVAVRAPPGLAAALGTEPSFTGKNELGYLLAEVSDEQTLRGLTPDLNAIGALPVNAVAVTARGSGSYDFVSRFFGPKLGVPEDPVTGSAHCALAPFWAERLGQRELTGFQASARGGEVRVRAEGDRVHLGGRAVTVIRGTLLAT